jgi:preprotein translocase subunit SecY
MTTGTMLLMWLGEQITERGIGNGVSLIITIGIVARLPNAVQGAEGHVFPSGGGESELSFLGTGIVLVLCWRRSSAASSPSRRRSGKFPCNTPARMVGRKMYQGGTSFMPLR